MPLLKLPVLAGLMIAGAMPAIAQAPKGDVSAGHQTWRIKDPGREIQMDLWYPATAAEQPHDYRFGMGSVAEDAAFADGRFPVIFLSHGAMGAATNYSWIAEPLARHGYLVVGISHYGESPVFGPQTINPAAASHFADRASDFISAEANVTMTPSPLRDHADTKRVGVIGHSSGGATALMLAHLPFSMDAMSGYCAKVKAVDKGCQYPVDGRPSREITYFSRVSVGALVLMDPAVGPGFTEDDLKAFKTPTLVIGATDNDFLPFDAHAGRIGKLLGSAQTLNLSSGEGHFVYLDRCTLPVEAMGVKICTDRKGVDRDAVHRKLTPQILAFFDKQFMK